MEISMKKDWFCDKPYQIDVHTIKAFGIEIMSRYGVAKEVIQMLGFCEALAEYGLSDFVEGCFYDGQSQCCVVTLHDEGPEHNGGPAWQFIHEIARIASMHLTQYDIEGIVGHKVKVS